MLSILERMVEDDVVRWFERYKRLRCWPRDLSAATVEVSRTRILGGTGRAYPKLHHVDLSIGFSACYNRMLVLHELTHLAVPHEGHGDHYRSVYVDAVGEVLGWSWRPEPSWCGSVYHGLDVAVELAFLHHKEALL